MQSKIPALVLFVSRFERCLEFYQEVMDLKVRRIYRGKEHPRWAELEGDGLTLALHGGHKGLRLKSADPLAVQFLVKDIRKAVRKAEQYGGKVKRPQRKIDFRPAELRLVLESTIADPDGNEISIQQVLKHYK